VRTGGGGNSSPFPVSLSYGGTALGNISLQGGGALPTSVIIPAGQDTAKVYYSVNQNNLGSGPGTFIINVQCPCGGSSPYVIDVYDPSNTSNFQANATCAGGGQNNGTISITTGTGGTGFYESSIDGGVTWLPSTTNHTGLAPGTYTVFIRDVGGCSWVTRTVSTSLTAGAIGSPQTICSGTAPATLTSTTAPSGGTYQWQSSPNGSTWTNIPGATELTYTPGTLNATTHYRRNVTNSCGTASTAAVVITMAPALTAGAIGTSQTICSGTAPAAFTSTTAASGGTYQWQSSPDGSSWTDIAGATSSTYAPGTLNATTHYRRNATNTCGTVSTTPVVITMASSFTAGAIGSNQSIAYGATPAPLTSTTPASGGTGTITYQWQSSPDSASWTDISGANIITYAPATLTATTYYRRVATCTCGTGYTNGVKITIGASASMITAYDIEICNGEPASFSASLTTPGSINNPIFRWYSAQTGGTLLYVGDTFTPLHYLTATTTYYVSVSGDDQSESPRKAVTVSVSPLATPNMIKITQ